MGFGDEPAGDRKAERDLALAIDVPDDALALELELDVTGAAEASFAPPRLARTTAPAHRAEPLSAERQEALRALAQLIGYVRFFHPSDQVAQADWRGLEVEAVHRLLAAGTAGERKAVLDGLLARVAPTARLYEPGHRPAVAPPPRGEGRALTRWVRIGSGDDGDPYSAFRTAMAEPADVGVLLWKTVAAQGCKRATVRLSAEARAGAPVSELYIIPRRGSGRPGVTTQVVPLVGEVSGDLPPDTTYVTYGVRIGGQGIAELSKLELLCHTELLGSFSSPEDPEIRGTARHLYTVERVPDRAGAFRITRLEETKLVPERDGVEVAIGASLRLYLPLAVWTDGTRTFPAAPALSPPPPLPAGDPASRLATVIDIWLTLRWFYPYFDDLQIDWDRALGPALAEAARATTADDLLAAASHLVAGLRDDHASVYRAEHDDGVIPLVFHALDSKLYIADGIDPYGSIFAKGSIVEAIDGVPANVVLARANATISAATAAWQRAYLGFVIGEGPAGDFVAIRARRPDGRVVTARVPRVSRVDYAPRKHEPRPRTGSELAAGVIYLDLATLDAETWKAVRPKLSAARGILCDTRDGATPTAFQILAHFIDHEIKSPYWDKPIASITGKRYERSQSSIVPAAPRLTARLLFVTDGFTASSPETILQYARAAGIGTVIGEPTGGTNGDVARFDTVAGLRVRFTGLRALNPDGTVFHGRGITPDLVVHPTPAGLAAGKDEILEAAVAAAAR